MTLKNKSQFFVRTKCILQSVEIKTMSNRRHVKKLSNIWFFNIERLDSLGGILQYHIFTKYIVAKMGLYRNLSICKIICITDAKIHTRFNICYGNDGIRRILIFSNKILSSVGANKHRKCPPRDMSEGKIINTI